MNPLIQPCLRGTEKSLDLVDVCIVDLGNNGCCLLGPTAVRPLGAILLYDWFLFELVLCCCTLLGFDILVSHCCYSC
jgi:hypothetical protein